MLSRILFLARCGAVVHSTALADHGKADAAGEKVRGQSGKAGLLQP